MVVHRRDLLFVLLCIAPALIVLLITIVFPTVYAVRLSLSETDFLTGSRFVGLANYASLLTDGRFWSSLVKTIVYAGGAVSIQVVLGIAIATLLNQRFPGNSILRGVSFVPYVIPTVVVAITWEFMLDPNIGVIPGFLENIGLGNIAWFGTNLALLSVILISVWVWMPFVTLVFLSALQTVPDELYESARVDGAGAWQRFWHITLPTLRSVIAIIVLLRGIWMFNKFDLVWLLTGGGPLSRTETLPILAYLKTFRLQEVGEGAAVAVTMLVVLLIATFVYFRILNLEEQ